MATSTQHPSTALAMPLGQLARLLRQRRLDARLSRSALASQAGLSESTVKNLESGRHLPSRTTLGLLCAVPDLHLDLPSLLLPEPGPPPTPDPPLNCWLAPGFEPLLLLRDLVLQINGSGGPLLRYGDDISSVEFSTSLDLACCPIPGSYAVEIRAHVRSSAGPARDRSYSLFRIKRHEPRRLAEHLRALGWEPS